MIVVAVALHLDKENLKRADLSAFTFAKVAFTFVVFKNLVCKLTSHVFAVAFVNANLKIVKNKVPFFFKNGAQENSAKIFSIVNLKFATSQQLKICT